MCFSLSGSAGRLLQIKIVCPGRKRGIEIIGLPIDKIVSIVCRHIYSPIPDISPWIPCIDYSDVVLDTVLRICYTQRYSAPYTHSVISTSHYRDSSLILPIKRHRTKLHAVVFLALLFPEMRSFLGWTGLQTVALHSQLALQDSQPRLPDECDLPPKPHQLPRQRRSGPASADNGLIGCCS